MSINIQQVPNAPGGYSLTGKKVMVHDQGEALGSSTVMVPATSLSTPASANYAAPIWKEADGDMTAGLSTFTHASLVGASQMNFIIVNKVIETIGLDYTFNDVSGTITRNNQWQAGDEMITPHKPG